VRNRKILLIIVFLGIVGTFVLADWVADPYIATLTCVVLGLSLRLATKSCYIFDLRRVGITSFWYLTYLAMIFLPAFIVYFDQPGLFRDRYLFAVESVLLTVPLGWWFATWIWCFSREEIDSFFQSPVVDDVPDRTLLLRCWLFLTACLLLMGAYVIEVKTLPLFYLIKHPGDAAELALLREDSFKLLNSPLSHAYYWVREVFFPLLVAVSLAGYLHLRGRKWLFTFAVASTAGLAFAAFSLAKAPVALIVLVSGLMYYLYRQGRPGRKAIAVVLILIFLFPVAVVAYASRSDSTTAWVVLGAIGYRLFYIPTEGVYFYFEIFPSHIPYLHGRAIDKFAKLMGMQYFDTPNVVGTYAFPQGLESVSANAAFIADLNADFGMAGVLLGGILTGMVMQGIQIFVLRRRKTVATLALFAFLIAVFWFLNSTALIIVLLSNGGIPALAITWFLDRRPNRGLLPVRV